ncbi:ABC transporter permease [Rhizobium sp. TRM95796]|uniref:ABC transporter permease n=1 Tax=Rhizobium sp. TRM95796 TaxID=2979862 RepID=UPI0021E75062|nr:ABC transporter permease [Rhizobium sp. TRM95796]MCV3766996.1 ABC transporter permease [Rhizobium sp. TRM95796]
MAETVKKPRLSPVNQRRLANFKANRRGYWSFWIFMLIFGLSLFAEVIANDKPILVSFKGQLYAPIMKDYEEATFLGEEGFLPTTDYKTDLVREKIEENGWMIWPPIRYSYLTANTYVPTSAPTKPFWLMPEEQRCSAYPLGDKDPNCTLGNMNWLGTDDQARDVFARIIYGFRLSVVFGLALTAASAVFGVTIGAIQGYFGGMTDLIGQRFIEIWSSMPVLYILLIMASILPPGFFVLLGILLLFSWTSFVGIVRAEFFRARNFEYVRAARALGVGNAVIMWRHLLPNAMVATLTFLPFILSGSISTLTALDFLGLGMPPGSPSLGEMVGQAKSNLQAPWLGFTAFFTLAAMLSLLIFIGEAVRDAFDPRKTFG